MNIKIEPYQELSRRIYATLADSDKKEWNGTKKEKGDWGSIKWRSMELPQELKQMQKNYDQDRIAKEKFGFGSRCLQWLADTIRIDDQFSKRLDRAESTQLTQVNVIERFNSRILSDPALFEFPERAQVSSTTLVTSQPDQLLSALGLPIGVPKAGSDDSLSHALESIRTAKNQLNTRFSDLKIALPKKDSLEKTYASDDHFTFAHVQLAAETDETDEPKDADTASIAPILNGIFISKLDQLIEDRDSSLQHEIKNILENYGISNDASVAGTFDERFKDWKAKQALIVGDLSRTIRESNWLLLTAIYPKYIRPQATIFARVVNDSDQTYRLRIAGYAIFVFYS